MNYTLTEEQFELLMDKMHYLENLVRDLAALNKEIMDACARDDPRLGELPQFTSGQAVLADIVRYLQH